MELSPESEQAAEPTRQWRARWRCPRSCPAPPPRPRARSPGSLVEEPGGVVGYTASEVLDGEAAARVLDLDVRLGEVVVVVVRLVDLGQQAVARAAHHPVLLVDRGRGRAGCPGTRWSCEYLLKMYLLRKLGDVLALAEEAVQLLVAVVDADLLERAGLERLEAEDVQGADVRLRRRAAALRRQVAGKRQALRKLDPPPGSPAIRVAECCANRNAHAVSISARLGKRLVSRA